MCEVVRRIIGQALMKVIGKEVLQAAGPLHLRAGQNAGSEAAIHALRELFERPETEAIILVDASNAFNNLNRQVALQHPVPVPSHRYYAHQLVPLAHVTLCWWSGTLTALNRGDNSG